MGSQTETKGSEGEMKYVNKSFSLGPGNSAYRDNYDSVFRKSLRQRLLDARVTDPGPTVSAFEAFERSAQKGSCACGPAADFNASTVCRTCGHPRAR